MNNTGLIKKMKKDMHMRNFSKYTYDSYLLKTKDIMRYFGDKQLENVTKLSKPCDSIYIVQLMGFTWN